MKPADEKLIVEYTEHLKCPTCNRVTAGEKDYISLVKGSNAIKKSCVHCRKASYESYKKSHDCKLNKAYKMTAEELSAKIDAYEICWKCKKPADGGIDDFRHITSKKIVKTCCRCRDKVLALVRQRNLISPPVVKKKITNREKIGSLEQCNKKMTDEIFTLKHNIDLYKTIINLISAKNKFLDISGCIDDPEMKSLMDVRGD